MSTLVATTEVKTWGNSLAIRIPKKVKDAIGLHDGSQMSISLDGNKIILENEYNPFFDLSKDISLLTLLSKITSQNRHSDEEFEDMVIGQ